MSAKVRGCVVGAHTHKHLTHRDITDRSVYAADIPEQVIDLPIGHDIPCCPASAVVFVGEPLGCEQLDIFLVDCHTVSPFGYV